MSPVPQIPPSNPPEDDEDQREDDLEAERAEYLLSRPEVPPTPRSQVNAHRLHRRIG